MRIQLFLFSIIIFLFLCFQPRIPNYFSAHARKTYFSHLLSNTVNNNHLDPQQYWQTREFYYPGVFYVYQDGLSDQHISSFQSSTQISLFPASTFPILVYSSPKWHSYEALVNTVDIKSLLKLPAADTIYSDSQTQILQSGKTKYIIFIKPYDELKITNGFIYTKEAILKNYQYWFGVSAITE